MGNSERFTSPALREYTLRARHESEEVISALANCHSRVELLRGFRRVGTLVRQGTGNDQLAATAEMVAASGSQFSEDQLRTLRDDFVRNAHAFISATDGSV